MTSQRDLGASSSPEIPRRGGLGRNFRWLWIAFAGSNLADGVFRVALPLLALRLTRSPAVIAAVTAVGRLPWLFFALHAGAIADRVDRRRTMALVNAGRGIAIGTIGLLVVIDAATVPLLLIVAFALGIGETLFDTAGQTMIPSLVGRDDLPRANSRIAAVEIATNQFIGPPLGGAIAGVAIAAAFFGSSGAYIVAAIALANLRGRFRAERSQTPSRMRADISQGVSYVWNHAVLRRFALIVGALNLVSAGIDALLPIFAVKPGPLGLSEPGFGLLLTAAGIGSLLGSFIANPAAARMSRRNLLIVNVTLMAALPIALTLTSSAIVVAAAFVITGLNGMIWNIITVSIRQAITPDQLMGRMISVYRLLAWGTIPIGAGLAGIGAELTNSRTVFAILAGVSVALILAILGLTDATITHAEESDITGDGL